MEWRPVVQWVRPRAVGLLLIVLIVAVYLLSAVTGRTLGV
jgi:hypothetical protein